MKHLKKLGSVLLALVMVMALMVPAFAAGTGSITVTNATIDETYSYYKIFDAEYSDTANAQGEKDVIYTIKETDKWYDLVSADTSPFALTASADGSKYFVTVKSNTTDAQVVAWLQSQTSLPQADDSEKAESTKVEFTNLALGYYMVKSTLNGGGVITLTNANPNATVKDKNIIPSDFDKKLTQVNDTNVSEETVNKSMKIGDTGTFELSLTATNYGGGTDGKKVTDYVLRDDMPDGMQLVANSIEVKVGGKTLDAIKGEYYVFYGETDTDDFKIVIPWVANLTTHTGAITKDFTAGNQVKNLTEDQCKALYLEDSLYDSPIGITVTYDATLLDSADIDNEGNVNTAYWDYDAVSSTGTPKDPDEKHETETVYTYALAIKKVNLDGEPLSGAEFTLTDSNGAVLNVKVDTNEDGTTKDGYYIVDENGTATITSPANGIIVIQGLDDGKYTLTETKAPEGYNKLTSGVTVEAKLLNSTETKTDIYLNEDGNVVESSTTTTTTVNITLDDLAATAYAVVNRTGTQLPNTGGIGTTIFYIVGGVLVVGAVVLLITKRRTSVDDE